MAWDLLQLTNGTDAFSDGKAGILNITKKGLIAAKDWPKMTTALIKGDQRSNHHEGAAMKTKEGDKFKNAVDGAEYVLMKIVNRMALLESKDGKRQILTEVDNLRINSFYQKMELNET
jgi:hypothetical protein